MTEMSMNKVIHGAFRRDLDRFITALGSFRAGDQRRALRAIRSSILWLLGWLVMLQVTAALMRSIVGMPLTGVVRVALLLIINSLLWWWTPRLLLTGRVSWRGLLPGAVITAILVVALGQLSSLFMPTYARANLNQFGPLGVVFPVATWLVLFGGALVAGSSTGRVISDTRPRDSYMRVSPRV